MGRYLLRQIIEKVQQEGAGPVGSKDICHFRVGTLVQTICRREYRLIL